MRMREDVDGRDKPGHDDGAAVIARSQRVRPSAGPMINSATKQSTLFRGMDCFASLAMTEEYAVATHTARLREPRSDAGNKSAPPKNLFIIFVDAIFTTLFEPPFTNVFDVMAQTSRFLACISRAPPINSLAT
jgi:hypothetical protein